VSLIGIIGGGTVLSLFDAGTEQFGAYALGLFIGFFAYFGSLLILVGVSPNFTMEWFLDGRRKDPEQGWGYGKDARGTVRPMIATPNQVPQVVVMPQQGPGQGMGAPQVVITPQVGTPPGQTGESGQ
jgi:hypothetical protein